MAAGAGKSLTRHSGEPTAHQLESGTIFVQRLERDRRVRRRFEHHGTVVLHFDGAKHHARVPRTFHADEIVTAGIAWRVFVGEDTQAFHRSVRHPFQAGAVIQTGDEDRALGVALDHAVHRHYRARLLLHGHRFEQVVVRRGYQRQDVVIDIRKADHERLISVRGDRDQYEIVGQRTRMNEEWTRAIDQTVFRLVLDRFSVAGNFLNGAFHLVATLGNVKEHQFANAGDPVVPRDNPGEAGGRSRNRTRIKYGVRPVRVAAVELLLVGAVRIHRHQHAREIVGGILVFPAEIENAAVGQHGGAPVVVLLKGEAAN